MSNGIAMSICLPTYNRANMLPAVLESVLPQLADDDEFLISDNHSTDDTTAVLDRYACKQMRVERTDRTVSIFENHNRCATLATRPWVLYIHSDDILRPDAVRKLRAQAAIDGDTDCFYPFNQYVHPVEMTKRATRLSGPEGICTFIRYPCGAPSGALYRRGTLVKQPFVDNGNLATDYLWIARMLNAGGAITIMPELTIDVGLGAFQASHSWTKTGRFVRDAGGVIREIIEMPGVLDALLKSIPDWKDDEIARCMMFLAHAGSRSAIRQIQKRLGSRRSYRAYRNYRHVRVYNLLGTPGLNLGYSAAIFLHRIKAFLSPAGKTAS